MLETGLFAAPLAAVCQSGVDRELRTNRYGKMHLGSNQIDSVDLDPWLGLRFEVRCVASVGLNALCLRLCYRVRYS